MSLRGCLCLQAASAQTADPKAVRPGVLLVCASAFGSADCGLCPGRAAANERGGSSQNRKQMCSANGKRTGKHPCARQDLARRVQEVAIKQLETAQQAVTTAQEVVGRLTTLWLAERPSGSEKANLLKQELNEAKKELREANREVDKAKQEVEKASASVQAGRVRAGASACAVVAVAFDLHSRMVVVRFRGGPPLLLFGVVLSSQQGSPRRQAVSAAFTSGSGRGFSELPSGKGTFVAQAKVSRKSGCTSCFTTRMRMQRGVLLCEPCV